VEGGAPIKPKRAEPAVVLPAILESSKVAQDLSETPIPLSPASGEITSYSLSPASGERVRVRGLAAPLSSSLTPALSQRERERSSPHPKGKGAFG